MAYSKTEVELLVKVGVLEKLVDRLTDRVDKLEHLLTGILSKIESVVSDVGGQVSDEWAIDNANGTVDKKEVARDDLGQLLDEDT